MFVAQIFVIISLVTGLNSLEYPEVRRDEHVKDDYFGTIVADPYRWLETPNDTAEYVEAQNNLTNSYVEECPVRDTIRSRLTAMWNYPKIDPPSRHGGRYFYFANSGLLNQKVLYVKDNVDSPPSVFFDPNEISENGTVAINSGTFKFSHDGFVFAYGLSTSGSDWVRIQFKDTRSGVDLPDVLRKAKFTDIVWDSDSLGVFYGAYPHMEEGDPGVSENQKILYHRIGTSQDSDVVVAEFTQNPQWLIAYMGISEDGNTLVITPEGGGSYGDNVVFIARVPETIEGLFDWVPVVGLFNAQFKLITVSSTRAIFQTNKNAPNYRVIRIDLDNPNETNWSTVVEEDEKRVIDWAHVAHSDKLVISYLDDVKSLVSVRNLTDGSVLVDSYELDIGTVLEHSQSSDNDALFFFKFESFIVPTRIYMVDFSGDLSELQVYEDVVIEGLNPDDFVTKQVFYPSYDGVVVPMFIVHMKNVSVDGSAYANLYGYGGFNLKSQPQFSVPRVVFMKDFRGVVAIANLRGGGEYGEEWHSGGKLDKKQNVFNDFQAAGEYLVKMNYTSRNRLVIEGRSNGGLLVGACVNQRPDLFGAALAHVGVMDMLRYHLFTIGYSWIPEYGYSGDADQFAYIFKYSPVHNIRSDVEYPAVLVTTSLQDDRVVPAHSLKFAAELQFRVGNNQTNPLLIRIEDEAGHGAGKPTAKVIEEQVDIFSFLVQSIGLELK